jgi:predicted NUDIX family NTP pyrophosphohydrolase
VPKLSAGLLAYRPAAGAGLQVLLVHPGGPFWRGKEDHAWSIPKGEYGPGADPASEATREFEEELGIGAPRGPRLDLGTIRQAGGKQVRAWAVEAPALEVDHITSNEFEMEWPPRSGKVQSFPEVDRAEWMDLDTARRRVVTAQATFFDRLVEALRQDD